VTQIIWILQAIEDVEAIHAYIARDSPHYAIPISERIVDSVERLKEFPRSGRVVPEVGREPY
jgi:plasmid stabilization system protein ParE